MSPRLPKLVLLLATGTLLSCAERSPEGQETPNGQTADSVAVDGRQAAEPQQPPGDTAEASPQPRRPDTAWTAGVIEREDRSSGAVATPVLTAVRAAHHAGFERIVFEFDGSLPGYRIEYIDRPVRQCGSGDVVALPGDAWLSIRLFPVHAHTGQGAPTVADRDRSFSGRNLKRLKLICDFEAVVEWVAAVASPNRFHVFELNEPARLVVDIRE